MSDRRPPPVDWPSVFALYKSKAAFAQLAAWALEEAESGAKATTLAQWISDHHPAALTPEAALEAVLAMYSRPPSDAWLNRLMECANPEPQEVLYLWRAILLSPATVSTPLENVTKIAVKALRNGMVTGDWSVARRVLFSDLCDRYQLTATCGLIDLCCEVILEPETCYSSIKKAVASLPLLSEQAKTCVDSLSRIVSAYICFAACYVHYDFERFDFITLCLETFAPFTLDILRDAEDDVAKAALLRAARNLMAQPNCKVRTEALQTLAKLVEEPRWASEAAAFAQLATRALGESYPKWMSGAERLREMAATLMLSIMERYPAAITPEAATAGIPGALKYARDLIPLHTVLDHLARLAPEGVMEGHYHAAVRRLKGIQELSVSEDSDSEAENRNLKETHSDAFVEVFLAARLTGELCKDDFVQQFVSFLNWTAAAHAGTVAPSSSNEKEVQADCYACYEKKADVVAVLPCVMSSCGECACSKPHFCTSCFARIFLEAGEPFKVRCPICRRKICADNLLKKTAD